MLFQVEITNYSLQTLSHTTDTHKKQTLWESISHISSLLANSLTQDIYTYILLSLWTHDSYLIVLRVVHLPHLPFSIPSGRPRSSIWVGVGTWLWDRKAEGSKSLPFLHKLWLLLEAALHTWMWQWSTRGLSRILEMLPKIATACVIVQWFKQLTQEAEVEPSASSLEFFPITGIKTSLGWGSALPSPLLNEYYWMVILSGVWREFKNNKAPSSVSCDHGPSQVVEESWVSAGLPRRGQLFWRSSRQHKEPHPWWQKHPLLLLWVRCLLEYLTISWGSLLEHYL